MCGRCARRQTIEIEMIERQTICVVPVDERERRTRDFACVNTERGGETFNEDGLARAERPVEQNDLAARQRRTDARAECEGRRLVVCLPSADGDVFGGGAHRGSSPAASSARTAAPKCSRMSEATIVRMPCTRAARSPARPAR